MDQFIERKIVTGLVVSQDYIQTVRLHWNDELLESPELRRIAALGRLGRHHLLDERVECVADRGHIAHVDALLRCVVEPLLENPALVRTDRGDGELAW